MRNMIYRNVLIILLTKCVNSDIITIFIVKLYE